MKSLLLSFCLIAGCRFRAHHANLLVCQSLRRCDGDGEFLNPQLYPIDGNRVAPTDQHEVHAVVVDMPNGHRWSTLLLTWGALPTFDPPERTPTKPVLQVALN